MALSLEAVLTVPICIVVFSVALSRAVPSYLQANASAVMSVKAVGSAIESNSVYKSKNVTFRQYHMSTVSTRPDGIIELYRLGRDILRPIGGMFYEETGVDDNE